MQAQRLGVVVLAAGEGTRMRSALPKVLHPICGRPLVDHVLQSAWSLEPTITALVVAPHTRAVLEERFGEHCVYAEQRERRGTGHALQQAQPLLEGAVDRVLVLYAADPLMRAESMRALLDALDQPGTIGAITTFTSIPPTGYGRIVRDDAGHPLAIVEEREATPEQRAITEVNQGVVAYDAAWLWPHLSQLQPSLVKGEYYLTDLVAMAVEQRGPGAIAAVHLEDPSEALGVNDRWELAQAEAVMRQRILRDLMREGVTVVDPAHTYVDAGVVVGRDSVLLPGTMLRGATVIGERCQIGPYSVIENSTIANGCRVTASYLEQAVMDEGSNIGPMSHLRPGAHLGPDVHVGNFAEVNRSSLGAGSKMGHVSYMGDATVGENVNIGAGTITANFGDKRAAPGARKHKTVIEADVKIGSDTMLVAPVKVGAGAVTGAGSVVTKDIPPGAVALGVPARVVGRTTEEDEA